VTRPTSSSVPSAPEDAERALRLFRHGLACIATLGMSACAGDRSSPVPTAPAAWAILRIEPAVIELYHQESIQLSAVLEFGDGSRQAVSPQWSTYPVSVAFINSTGLLSGGAIGKVIVTARSGEYSSGVEVDVKLNPARADPSSIAGQWSGRYVLEACEHLSGAGLDSCWKGLPSGGPLRLDLSEEPQLHLIGNLTVGSELTGQMTGWRAGVYMFLTGTLSVSGGAATAEVVQWDVRLGNSFPNPFRELEGRIVLAIRAGTDRYLAVCRLVSVERP
jgi:hypothetical protein